MTEKELLAVACEQFLGKNVQDVKNVVLQTLEGHLRSILGMEGLIPCRHLEWLCPFSAGWSQQYHCHHTATGDLPLPPAEVASPLHQLLLRGWPL